MFSREEQFSHCQSMSSATGFLTPGPAFSKTSGTPLAWGLALWVESQAYLYTLLLVGGFKVESVLRTTVLKHRLATGGVFYVVVSDSWLLTCTTSNTEQQKPDHSNYTEVLPVSASAKCDYRYES